MLEDTSFAILPENKQDTTGKHYLDIGNVLSIEKQQNMYQLTCTNGFVTLCFYTDAILRVVMNPTSQPVLDLSKSIHVTPLDVSVSEEDSEAVLLLKTKKLEVKIEKNPLRITVKDENSRILVKEQERGMAYDQNGEIRVWKQMEESDHFYGFGEKSGFLDKRGEKYEMWNTDVYAPHNPETDPLYESIPYFMTLRNGKAHGIFFDNTFRTFFDMKSEIDRYSFSAEGGQLDYYVLAGPDPKKVLEQYTYLTGRMPIPPKWAIGYHQSRYSYETEAEVRELAANFLERDIPVDVIHLDIHYMNGYRVFTFDRDRFPNPEKLIADLREMGIRVVPIVDPGVKQDAEYPIYQEGVQGDNFCKYIEGDIYFGDVWPGKSAFPDFTDEKVRKWWGEKHAFYTDMGIDGIWNDMNEPAVFNETKTMDTSVMHRNDGRPTTHKELHNVYGLLMGKATYEGMKDQLQGKRPFLLTRAGYSGVQRYAAVWTGDNRSFWEHLQMSLPMVMNLGLSGVAFTGPDVGGFAHDTNPELLVRWTQVGAFTPYFRNHSALNTKYQEPWQFGEKYETIMKNYMQMRYEWLPQLYSLFFKASQTGLPVMRPLFMEYPDDERTYNLNDVVMIGDNVLLAPILSPGVTDRAVYLPEGEWILWATGETFEGNRAHLVHAELADLPLFIKKGTAVMQTKWVSNQEKETKQRSMHVVAGNPGDVYSFTYYDDDGETFAYEKGDYLKWNIEIKSEEDAIHVTILDKEGNYLPPYKEVDVNLAELKPNQNVILNGKTYEDKQQFKIIL
ncbi:glycoside hydrolase family 31 protein [Oceanobacillus jordanicus]|uniref:Glycoside hydrolase family 31 protein n=1 Tax=Oceanobacillus jordanicus TaxID=2867266 RepID=A0AAW5B7W2_9BACI|nr:glycoside hydrolase family 31 protein [Oceanobacillus jordanicus]MCG3420277.1 glycoside hydrolase family 31 protein [Oceanobacillus jordanicus]